MASGQATPVVPSGGKPDPTVLTTQQINERVNGLREVIEARLNGMDKAVDLLQKRAESSPSIAQVNDAVICLAKLHEEKFGSIQTQFKERDTRTDQTSRDSKIAIDAALQAAKEAVGKTEQTFTKQIDQINVLINTTQKASDDKIGDIKDRLTALESRTLGANLATVAQQQTGRDNTANYALIVAGIVAAVGIASFVAARFAV